MDILATVIFHLFGCEPTSVMISCALARRIYLTKATPRFFTLDSHYSLPFRQKLLEHPWLFENLPSIRVWAEAVAPSGATIPSVAARTVTVSHLTRLMEKKRSAKILKIYAYGDLRDQGRGHFWSKDDVKSWMFRSSWEVNGSLWLYGFKCSHNQ